MSIVSASKNAWSRLSNGLKWTIIGVVIFLAVVRLILPYAVLKYVNRQLNKTSSYSGHVANIHIQLWRGRYRIDGLEIFKRSGDIKTPFFSANQIHLSVEWKELIHGSLVGEIIMHEPKVNFVSGPSEAQTQTGKDESWTTVVKSLFPIDLNRFEIIRGQVHFQNEYSKPPVDISLDALALTATNLTNSRKIQSDLPSGVTARSTTVGGGNLDLQMQLNPLAKDPTYQLTAQLTNVDLVALNEFLKAYGKFDVKQGQFALFTSIASKDGTYDGYIKVFLNNLRIFSWQQDKKKDVLDIFWQAIVGTANTVLKNHPKDSLATRIPISGSNGKSKVGTLTAVGTVLRNAFIRALVPSIDEKMTVDKVGESK